MKSDLNIKSDNIEEIINGVEILDKFTSIFKLNNGQALERELSLITGTSYKFTSKEYDDNFKFTNEYKHYVEIDKNGKLITWPTAVPTSIAEWFTEIAQMRFGKTSEMLEKIRVIN